MSPSSGSLDVKQTYTCHHVLMTSKLLGNLVTLLLQLLVHSRALGRCALRAGE